ncbi:TIR domain-containing protein [Actinoplanes sp. NPDC051346]|uniref:phosphorylase family protein n=1 Tax=Actinoplanes sp. NPDC051346 TaxID=3155048 RepID=UPI00343940D5
MGSAQIPTYFSHSYRPADRLLNAYFLDYFWDNGFAFAVDSGTKPLSTTQLEVMMRFSAAFVAVVTRRREPSYLCSPFIVYEYGLAVQAGKPRLVIAEKGVPEKHFPEATHTVYFDRDRLVPGSDAGEQVRGLGQQVARLAEESRPYTSIGDRPLGAVGVVLPRGRVYREAARRIEELIDSAGYTVQRVDPGDLNAVGAALRFDTMDFVVHDAGRASGWLLPFLQGRFIPAIRLVHQPSAGPPAVVHPLLRNEVLADATKGGPAPEETVVRWSTLADIERAFHRLPVPRRQFRSAEEGSRYLYSLGRSLDEAVFLSSAGEDHELAMEVGRALDLKNVPLFHYQFRNTIPLGARWADQLDDLIRGSSIFVALISRHYLESPYCAKELATARAAEAEGLLTIVPYYLDESGDTSITSQGATLTDMRDAERAKKVAEDIDGLLLRPRQSRSPRRATPSDGPPAPVDIAVLTILLEEYQAVLALLESPERHFGRTDAERNRCDWHTGRIGGADGFRVVLARVTTGNAGAAVNAVRTIELFKPKYVLVVGVAGAIDERLHPGDVVVASQVVGYEYGAAGPGGFEPRSTRVWPTDDALTTTSGSVAATSPDWARRLRALPPDGTPVRPAVLVGPVASGDKVVDDLRSESFAPVLAQRPDLVAVEMEAAGVCAAVHDAGDVRFAMIRGISDRPMRGAAPDASRSGQTAQRDMWKAYAAATAAAYTEFLISRAWPERPRGSA